MGNHLKYKLVVALFLYSSRAGMYQHSQSEGAACH